MMNMGEIADEGGINAFSQKSDFGAAKFHKKLRIDLGQKRGEAAILIAQGQNQDPETPTKNHGFGNLSEKESESAIKVKLG